MNSQSRVNSDHILSEIRRIIFEEQRPFSCKDFVRSKDESDKANYVHGNVRNVFSSLKKEGLIKLVYRSPQAFYTLTGVEFEKGMTPSYRRGSPKSSTKEYD